MTLADIFCFGTCNTQWEVLLSKQVVVKCQILQECFLQNFNMQKFHNIEHSNSRTFKDFQGPTLFSRTFKGLEFFLQIQGLLKDPMNPDEKSGMLGKT